MEHGSHEIQRCVLMARHSSDRLSFSLDSLPSSLQTHCFLPLYLRSEFGEDVICFTTLFFEPFAPSSAMVLSLLYSRRRLTYFSLPVDSESLEAKLAPSSLIYVVTSQIFEESRKEEKTVFTSSFLLYQVFSICIIGTLKERFKQSIITVLKQKQRC